MSIPLQNTENTFNSANKAMTDFDLNSAEELLKENITQLDSCLYPPYREYHLTQENYMKIGLARGNVIIKEEHSEEKKET